ncbi:MAG: ABC transporter permease [Lentisphaerae bacterium]|nr:ABC transporter permease [Lentisphaerota bacterium]
MLRYVIKRLLELIPTTAGVLLLTFALFHVLGGSPAEVVLGKNASAESMARFDAKYGYDKPLLAGWWAPSRALNQRSTATDDGTVPLSFPLNAGEWRLRGSNIGKITVELRNSSGGERQTVTIESNSGEVRFTIPVGFVADRVTLADYSGALELSRRTAHWFDSQLCHFLYGLARGDLGVSTDLDRPVAAVLREGVGPSLALTVPILICGTLLAMMFGLWCAWRRDGTADRILLTVSTLLMSVNYVIWVLAGQFLLAYKLRLFPIWGFENWTYLVLPIIIGVVSGLGRDIRFCRTAILDEVAKPYVRTALAKGLSEPQVMVRHVLRNSLIPIVTYVSLSVPFLFTGSLLLESFFGIPGLGSVSLNAINSNDMAVVRAVVIIGALSYQAVNVLADLSYAWLDPRVRLR